MNSTCEGNDGTRSENETTKSAVNRSGWNAKLMNAMNSRDKDLLKQIAREARYSAFSESPSPSLKDLAAGDWVDI